MNIEKINKIVEEFVEEEPITEDEFIFIRQLINIILDSKLPSNNTKYRSHMRFNTSLKHSLNFLESIDKRYRLNLENMFDNKQVLMLRGNGLSQLTAYDGISVMEFYERGTIEDSYTLTHENIHDTNRDLSNLTVNWHLMTEAFSILSELLQRDYFSKLSSIPKDYHLNELDTLVALKIKACQLDFEINLICTYLEYGFINDYLFYKCLEGKDNFYAESVVHDMLQVIKQGDLNFSMLQRNVIGGVLSSHMYERIKSKPSRVREFVELNDSANEMAFMDTIHYLDLDVLDPDTFMLDKESVKVLSYEYKKRCKGVF
jgi:hypothetical protein